MSPARWELYSHDADMGVRGRGDTLAAALEQAAVALTAVVTDPSDVRAERSVSICCSAQDPELLLYDWLNAVIAGMAEEHMLFARYHVDLHDGRLTGTALGETVDVARHQPRVEVKGATFTDLRVQRQGGEWMAQCVVDV